jgi:hypothetical protein
MAESGARLDSNPQRLTAAAPERKSTIARLILQLNSLPFD